MKVLAIDCGSSSVKAGILRDGRIVRDARFEYPTRRMDLQAEIDPASVLRAIARAIRSLGALAKDVDAIAIDSMSPSWIAMDRRGKPVTPIISHEDRRSLQIAVEIEKKVGRQKHLNIVGTRPIPGGISSTVCAWFLKHEKSRMRHADLVGHLTTFLHRQFTGARVVDPSHASFMGLYNSLTHGGWNDDLCAAIGISKTLLPEVKFANEVGGKLTSEAARRLGLTAGLPMLTGMIDTGAAMLLAGAKVGQMVNVVGSTDVLALCTDRPRPHERLLTRSLGIRDRWLSVGTLASAGSSIAWARKVLFSEPSEKQFFQRMRKLSGNGLVRFDPYLAGDRCAVEQRRATFEGLTLGTTREQMLAAIVESLAQASAERLQLLRWTGTRMHRKVLISGGGGGELAKIMHRDWTGKWSFNVEEEATMRGLARLV